ncbi:hypothetical protein BDA96_01G221800 [Sorghum bicolor]|uniref:Uncharacterized protein n=2 Tax=Sorghum bicolor TaxID=4558 RepID=A0A921V0Y0_SORBI|nr:hypothetical protein BDA96_01G221800 [Sorghum bicolor]OQU91580.1 hypothetical protein SORBI_3001G208166 [Sorghum bicolor]
MEMRWRPRLFNATHVCGCLLEKQRGSRPESGNLQPAACIGKHALISDVPAGRSANTTTCPDCLPALSFHHRGGWQVTTRRRLVGIGPAFSLGLV